MKKKQKRQRTDGGTWNHRVVKRTYTYKRGNGKELKEVVYGIHEAHYNRRSTRTPWAITADPIDVVGDNVTGLRWTLRAMLRALKTPVLDYDTRREIREATPVKAKR